MTESRKPLVFLCHTSQDKPSVRKIYQRLRAEGWMDAWLDEDALLPGQDWNVEIEKAVEAAAVVIVFVSNNSITKEGYIQKELRFVLDIADEKPEGAIFVIPLRLNDCPIPRRLRIWHRVDFFPDDKEEWAYQKLKESILKRSKDLGVYEGLPDTLSKPIIITRGQGQSLVDLANEARRLAYAPYSNYLVGAALRASSGRIYTGCNIENAAYPESVCAERVAVFKAVSEGERMFDAIAVVTSNGGSPCGSCRQVLAEFGLDTIVLVGDGEGRLLQETTVAGLLPGAFTPRDLLR